VELHPGVHVALARGRMDEAQLARAIAAGELASPQSYGNSWFFDFRITGVGGAYREAHKEYVWRDPSLYLNQGFLDRCNGLPIILEHPDKEMLDSKEYHDRNIGSIVYPYLRGEEVRGIGRILDAPAAHLMMKERLSTSPAVVFLPGDGNEKIQVSNGKHLLIEGKPSLLDHLAICVEGVWDKGGPPAGVDVSGNQREEATMPDKEKIEAENEDREDRHDTDGDKIDQLLSGIKVLSDRMDSLDSRSRRDETEDEDEEKREDRARRDEDKDDDPKEKEREEGGRGDRRARRDTDPEHEERQAEELHELAEEEEKEAEEAEDDSKKRDDSDIEEHFMPWEEAVRKEGEGDSSYSKRMDTLARRTDRNYAKRDDESIAAHCDRVAAGMRKDRARRDAQRRLDSVDRLSDTVNKLLHRFDSLANRLQDRTDEDEAQFADIRARADQVFEAHGEHSPRPMSGENLAGYRIRLARKLQAHSDTWKKSDIAAIARSDSVAFEQIEKAIYADAMAAAAAPTKVPAGTLREIHKEGPYGSRMIEFAGEPLTWMQSFMLPAQAARITSKPGQHVSRN
jgi:hypothetical protein